MNTVQVFRALGPVDVRQVGRDSLLRWVIFMPLLLAGAARWLLPDLLRQAETFFPWPLMAYYEPVMGFAVLLLVPYLVGFVVGFLLLDQRDDGTLLALQVTPLPMSQYLIYRLALPMLLSSLVSLVALPLSGLAPLGGRLLLTVLATAPQAVIFTLLLAVLAQNKVQGFALAKASGIILLPPIAALFAAQPWQMLLALVPTYWPAQMLWHMGEGTFWLYLIGGVVYQAAVVWWLLRRWVMANY